MTVRALLLALPLLLTACAPRGAEDCAADLDAMREVVADAVDGASYCERDSDCAIVDVSNACEQRCPSTVNVDAALDVLSQVHDAELSYCVGYGQACGFISVSCIEATPACVSNRCEMVDL